MKIADWKDYIRVNQHGHGYHDFGGVKVWDTDIAKEVRQRLNIIERLNVLIVIETAFEVLIEKASEVGYANPKE